MGDKSVADMKSELIELLGKKSSSSGISNNKTKRDRISTLIDTIKNEDAIKELYEFVTDSTKGKERQKEVHETVSGIKEDTYIGREITRLASAPTPSMVESSSASTSDIAGTAASIIGDMNAALTQIKTIITTKGDLTNPTIVAALAQLSATIGGPAAGSSTSESPVEESSTSESPATGSSTSGSSTTPIIIPFIPSPDMNISFNVKVDASNIYKEKGRWEHFKSFFIGKKDDKDAKNIASLYTIVVKLNFILYKLIEPTNKLNSLGSGSLEELIEKTIRNTPKDAPTIISNLVYTVNAFKTLVLEKVVADKALKDANSVKSADRGALIEEAKRKVAEVERASTALLNGRRKYLNEEAPCISHPPLIQEMLPQVLDMPAPPTSSSTKPATGLAGQSSQQEVDTSSLAGSSSNQTKKTSQSGISALGPVFNAAGMPRRNELLEDSDEDSVVASSSSTPQGGLASQGQQDVDTASVSSVNPVFSSSPSAIRRPEQPGDGKNAAAPPQTKASFINSLNNLSTEQQRAIPDNVTQEQLELLRQFHTFRHANPTDYDFTENDRLIKSLKEAGINMPQAGGAISPTDIYTPLYTEFYNILHTLSRDREFGDESQKKIMTSMIEFITNILEDFRKIASDEGIKGGAKTLRRSTQKKMRS